MGNVLAVNNLKTYYYTKDKVVPAVDGVSFSLNKREVLGIVGESGCGKSTIARSIVGLLNKAYSRIEEGEVLFSDQDLVKLKSKDMCRIRGNQISMIFQDPFVSLNPAYTVENQIWEVLKVHQGLSKKQSRKRIRELLQLVGIPSPELRMKDYPHQLSGGMQQRVMIAIALAFNPQILIADEPTTALDVTVQAQILNLITKMIEEFNMSMILITHNMGIVAEMCNRILVMYGGVAVEQGDCRAIFSSPLHPYTQGLLASIPSINEDKEELYSIKGHVPVFTHPVKRCRFADRCPQALERCNEEEPPLFELDEGKHLVRCWLYK